VITGPVISNDTKKPYLLPYNYYLIIIIITVNFTVINMEPRAIFHGVKNAVEAVFITVHDKLLTP